MFYYYGNFIVYNEYLGRVGSFGVIMWLEFILFCVYLEFSVFSIVGESELG